MSVYIHKKVKICFICKKKISRWKGLFIWNYWDFELGRREEKNGISYNFIDKYWHVKCAWDTRPLAHHSDEQRL